MLGNKQMLRTVMMRMMVKMVQNRGLLTAKISAKHDDGLISIQVSNSARFLRCCCVTCVLHSGGVKSCVTSSCWPVGGGIVLDSRVIDIELAKPQGGIAFGG